MSNGHWAMTAGARRAVVFLFALSMALGAASLLWTSRQVGELRSAVLTQCRFDADLGSAPVVAPHGIRPSRLGVTIVSDSRIAWHGLGCPGQLAPPDQSFARWARFYHLPYR